VKVRFAVICDHCHTRGPEYGAMWVCRGDCCDDVCPACAVEGSCDDESGTLLCKRCAEAGAAVPMPEEESA